MHSSLLSTLHQDSTCMLWVEMVRDRGSMPLQALFDNLRLPALRTLSFTSEAMTWYSTTALTEVHAALLVRARGHVALGVSFLGDLIYGATAEYLALKTIGRDAELLAASAPRLEHLRVALASPLRLRGAFDFVARRLPSGHWLHLENAESRVRVLTFVPSDLPPDDPDLVAELADKRLLIAEVQRFIRDEVDVGFCGL